MKRLAAALAAILLSAPAWAQFQGPAAPYLTAAPTGGGGGAGCLTLGSTSVCIGSTYTTVTGLTLSGGTLSGATTLPGSGQITAAGEVGVLGAPLTALQVGATGGTYTNNSATSLVQVLGTFATSQTGTLNAILFNQTLNPTGASAGTLVGFGNSPVIKNGSLAVTNVFASQVLPSIASGSSGAITNVFAYNAGTLSNSGTSVVSNYVQFRAAATSYGDGITAGSITLTQFQASGISTGAAGGTVNNRAAQLTVPSGGASSGTANNRGLYINGNGGTASGGTVNNFAIYSDSTALSAVLGGFQLGTNTALTLTSGEMGFAKISASGSAPGAGGAKEAWVCGTNAGTAKKIAYAGTSSTPSTIVDNVGSGVTGC